MYIQKIIAFLICCCHFSDGHAQDFSNRFKSLQIKNDTASESILLKAWNSSNSTDPELYVSYFYYYVQKSIAKIPFKKGANMDSVQMPDSAANKSAFYLNSTTKFNLVTLQKGFGYIRRGIALFPNRLDMRFSYIYLLGLSNNFSEFATELIKAINYGANNNYAWLWKESKPLLNSKAVFLSSMQDFVMTIYRNQNNDLLPLMRKIAETILRYNPNHVESLTNIALTYLVEKRYAKAFLILAKAEKLAPEDVVVLKNIALLYKIQRHFVLAKTYFEKIIKVGSPEEIKDAQRQIKNLYIM